MQDCSSQIAQVEYQGQTLYTKILAHKPVFNTSYRIGHSLESKKFHFAQFLLNSRRTAYQPQKSEN